MEPDQFALLFALLAILANILTVALLISFGLARRRESVRSSLVSLSSSALWAGAAVAATCMAGSLYLSQIAKYPPCNLCWYQRIAMYPLVVVLIVAAIRRDRGVRFSVWVLCAIGASISTIHYLEEWFPESIDTSCSTEVPCSYRWIFEFGYISIPFMAGSGFLLIAALMWLARYRSDSTETPPAATPTSIDHQPEVQE